MARGGLHPAAALLAAGLVLTACAKRPAGPGEGADEPDLVFVVDAEGPWREVEVPRDGETSGEPVAAADPRPQAPEPIAVPPPGLYAPRGPVLAVPTRRATPEPKALGAPPPKSPRDLARERHLDHPTHIKAHRITFYCPRVFVWEVKLTGDDVSETRPGRRVASGRARLTCRELTLEGEKITLRIRDQEDADLQITARGDASLVTDQRGQVIRQEGARTLILTNERVVPLR